MTADRFVSDGYDRACSAIEKQVREEVAAQYRAKFAEATFWQSFSLKREMNREIRSRTADAIKASGLSSDSLY